MFRRIITINQARCNGCGLCASAWLKGAIGIVDIHPKFVKSYSNSNELSHPGWAALLYFRDMCLRIKK